MADITNRIIDSLELRGAEKYARDTQKATSALLRFDGVSKRARDASGKFASTSAFLKQTQAQARSIGTSDYAARYREWDAQRRLSRGAMERLQARRRGVATTPLAGGSGAGGIFAGSLMTAAITAGVAGIGALAKASLEAAGATDKWKAKYTAVTTAYEASVTKLKESVGNILMPTFTKLAKELGDAASDWALLLDPEKMKAIWKDAGTDNESELKARLRAKKLGIPYTNKYGHTIDPRKTDPGDVPRLAPSFEDMKGQAKVMDEAFAAMREAAEEQAKEAARQRQFQRNLQFERMEQRSRDRAPSYRDMDKFIFGGGELAHKGVSASEMAGAGFGRGGKQTTLKIEPGGVIEDFQTVLMRFLERNVEGWIRQGKLQAGN